MLPQLLLILLLLPPVARAVSAEPVILVLGDSLSAAHGMAQKSGWVSLLQNRLRRNAYDYRVVNTSISGETTRGALMRLDNSLGRWQPAIVIVELGANDGLRGLSLQTMRRNLAAIIEGTLAHHAQVLLLGMRLPPNYGPLYSRQFYRSYRQLAEHYAVGLLPFLLDGMAKDPTLFQQDGMHPTAAAQPILLANVWRVLRPLLSQRHQNQAIKQDGFNDHQPGREIP